MGGVLTHEEGTMNTFMEGFLLAKNVAEDMVGFSGFMVGLLYHTFLFLLPFIIIFLTVAVVLSILSD